VINSQHIAVLFYSKCETSPVYPSICIKPRVIAMTFYSENDMTLGSFLARNCFRNGYMCTNELCNTLIQNHTRYFVHCNNQIAIKMNIVPDDLPTTHLNTGKTSTESNDDPNRQIIKSDDLNIYMWTTCKKCQKVLILIIQKPFLKINYLIF
jgi:hypothetical protein